MTSGFSWNPIILNFAILISLFTQPIKFGDGQLVLSRSFGPLCFLSGSITDAYLSNGAFEEPPPAAFRIWSMMQIIDFLPPLLSFKSLLLHL